MISTIEDRVILLLKSLSESLESKYGFWSELGRSSGIETTRWRRVYDRKQRITSDMLEVLARNHPQYAFWLVTGITDIANGHEAPLNALTFPERPSTNHSSSYKYFMTSLELQKHLSSISNVNFADDTDRFNAIERKRLYEEWWDSELLEFAYYIAGKYEMYSYLAELQIERELEHKSIMQNITATHDAETTSLIKLGADPRTQHQSSLDLYYKPIKIKKSEL